MARTKQPAQLFEGFALTTENTSDELEHGLTRWGGRAHNGAEWEIHRGDALYTLRQLQPEHFHCVVTSPPYYWQRDYKVDGQLGQEKTIDDYVNNLSNVMDEVKRVLRKDGLLFLNLGDTYYSAKGQPKGHDGKNKARRFGLRAVDASGLGVPRKTSIGIPWRTALEMVNRGWTLRSPIVWRRKGGLPEPTAHDRPWRTYEMIFMFSRSPRYYFDRASLNGEEDVWEISERPKSSNGIHSAAFPEQLVEMCLRIGCPAEGRVLDPFAGTGTVLRVALRTGRSAVGIDLSPKFCDFMSKDLNLI